MMHRWLATQGVTQRCRLITVYAETEAEARKQVEEQLSSNPQRREILATWHTWGCQLRIEE